MKTKGSILFFLLIFLTSFLPLGKVLCQYQIEENIIARIEVRIDGSATIVEEHRFLLKTENDTTVFQQYLSEFKIQERLQEFSDIKRALVNDVSIILGRSMRAENFEISVGVFETVMGSYGVIKYLYNWIGFAQVQADKWIKIGDVFQGGLYLRQGDALIVNYPSGYVVVTASPAPDDMRQSDRTVVWYGLRTFGLEEPKIVLEKEAQSVWNVLWGYVPMIVFLTVIAGMGLGSVWLFKFRKKKEGVGVPMAMLKKIEDDEDKVIKLIRAAGGRIYQSTITQMCEFSKSKTSKLLITMENKGLVRREKKGRETLVTLIEKIDEFEGAK